jgi:hypothetical protein
LPSNTHFYPVRRGYLEVKADIEREISPLLIFNKENFQQKGGRKNANDGFSGETN